jgi:heme A synthase
MRWIHPVVAIVFWAFVSRAARQLAKMRNDTTTDQLATLLPLVMFLQLGLGALNLASLTPIWLQIVHLLVADIVWVLMVLLVASALRENK